MSNLSETIHKNAIAQAFNKAAATYDQFAQVQHEIGLRLLDKLQDIPLQPKRILDLGSGTGQLNPLLRHRYPNATLINFDIAGKMLHFAKQHHKDLNTFFCQGDIASLPFNTAQFDLIISNCCFQWIPNLSSLFAALKQLLKPDGFLLFSTFGPDTLHELRQSFLLLDDNPHVNQFVDMHHIGDQMLASGLQNPVLDKEFIYMHYPNVATLIHDLKKTGANYVVTGKRSAVQRQQMQQVFNFYQSNFQTPTQQIQATYEVIYAHACGQSRRLTSGSNDKAHVYPISVVTNHS